MKSRHDIRLHAHWTGLSRRTSPPTAPSAPRLRAPALRPYLLLPLLLLLLTLPLLGCGTAETTTTLSSTISANSTLPPLPTDTSVTLPTGTTGGPSTGTQNQKAGAYLHEPDYLAPKSIDLSAVVGLDRAGLTEAEKRVLARQSFVAVDLPADLRPYYRFWHIYEGARYEGLPVLVTTDSVLNAYHELFDTILQRLEERSFFQQAEVMTQALYNAASEQWNDAGDPLVKEDARRNMAYFSVALSLLGGHATGPDVVIDDVEDEVALIDAAAGLSESPLFGYTEDYSQYKPRGHYTRSQTLQRYFKTMMWYGHTGFFINPREPDLTPAEAASLTRRAILIASSLTGAAKEAWLAVYEPTSFLVGRADDLTADDVQLVLTDVFGTAAPEPDMLADPAKIEAVRTALNRLPAPKILSATVRTQDDTEGREENERGFRVMGQRYIPDSYAFQQLVWAHVGQEPELRRDMPMGLDIMTVLGSDQAYRLAKEEYTQDRYQNWEKQLAKVNDEFTRGDADLWPANLYTGWLEALQKVMLLPDERAPEFMRSRVWARKSLNTALGSWTELRHDTILYAKQSVVAEGDGGEESPVVGYVEPYPAFYAQIAKLGATLRDALTRYGLGDPETAHKLDSVIELAQTLESVAKKQLNGEALTLEEQGTVKYYGHYLEDLGHFEDPEEGRTLSPAADRSPLVADVHTSANTMRALEEATGYPLPLYAAFEVDGRLQLFLGAAYAYYEFTVPMNERLTDEEWQTMLDDGQAPPRPLWTNEWIVGR